MRRTPRLVLRPALDSDAAFIVELLTDPDFLRFIGDRGVRDEATALGYVARLRASYQTNGFGLYVVTTHDGEALGLCGLVKREALPHPDLGFAFLPRARGHGFAREAALDSVAEADALGIDPLLAICNEDNLPSRKLLEAVGFRFDGLTRLKDTAEDLCLYSHRR